MSTRDRDRPDDDEGFLSRWSRRKAASARGETSPEDATPPPEASGHVSAPAVEEQSEEEILAAHGLKRPEDLAAGDSVEGYMKADVPEALRRRAMRRLWSLNPKLANLDGLLEYGEDYTDAAVAVKTLQSLYEADGGYRQLFETFEAQKEAAASTENGRTAETSAASEEEASIEDPDPSTEEASDHSNDDAADLSAALPDGSIEPIAETPSTERAELVEPPQSQRPRRMRFRLDRT